MTKYLYHRRTHLNRDSSGTSVPVSMVVKSSAFVFTASSYNLIHSIENSYDHTFKVYVINLIDFVNVSLF